MVKLTGSINPKASMTGSIAVAQGGSGTNDYEKLINKPLVFDSSVNFPPTGNVERLYIATNVNKIYYWTGVTYAEISGSGGGGTDGKSPYIGENGNWYVYNDLTQTWVDTGVKAEGIKGADGEDGKSAYQVWLDNGNVGTELEFLASLRGDKGDKGDTGERGIQGLQGIKGDTGLPGSKGDKGDKGDTGERGEKGNTGDTGEKGLPGEIGKSAYEVAVEQGFTGTEIEWLASLKGTKGDKGDTGEKGDDGYTPIKGTDYFTPADIESLGIANKADTTYVDGLVGGINTELATKSTKPTVLTDLSSATQTVTLENNVEYRYGTLTSLTITWTTSDIHSAIAFTGGTGVVFSITAGVKIVGTDVTDGVFAPAQDKRYNLGFEYDGVNRTVYVSGVI